jgi:hypothetical protein
MIEPAAAASSTAQGEAVSIGPAVEPDSVIWTAKLRIGRVANFRASASKAFRAAALIDSVAVEHSAGIDSVARDLVAAVIGLAAAALAGLAGSAAADFAAAAADSGAADDN